MSKDTGGQAFPNITPDMNIQGGPGMTMRDYFAAVALPECLKWFGVKDEFSNHATAASTAYQIADAMLAERAKGGAE
jgi:hypothetical protein